MTTKVISDLRAQSTLVCAAVHNSRFAGINTDPCEDEERHTYFLKKESLPSLWSFALQATLGLML